MEEDVTSLARRWMFVRLNERFPFFFAFFLLVFDRRKSTIPRYDPPYLKRPLVNPAAAAAAAAGASAAGQMTPKPGHNNQPGSSSGSNVGNNTNHTSADVLSLEAGSKGISFGTMPSYR